jgi:hypothetical protein
MLIVNDDGPGNQLLTKELLKRFHTTHIQVAPYHPRSNGLVERGHPNIVDALAKLTAPIRKPGNQTKHLPAVSWAERITIPPLYPDDSVPSRVQTRVPVAGGVIA